MSIDVRDNLGRFATGNPGGPGRPCRAIEREYLATLGTSVSLVDWQEIVRRAVADAKAGDDKARAWLAKYLLGSQPSTLFDIAVAESVDMEPEQEVWARCRKLGFEVDEEFDE